MYDVQIYFEFRGYPSISDSFETLAEARAELRDWVLRDESVTHATVTDGGGEVRIIYQEL